MDLSGPIETEVVVREDGHADLPLPDGVSPGRHRIMLFMLEPAEATVSNGAEDFLFEPIRGVPLHPELSLKRSDWHEDEA